MLFFSLSKYRWLSELGFSSFVGLDRYILIYEVLYIYIDVFNFLF